jgi:hypothetical protein
MLAVERSASGTVQVLHVSAVTAACCAKSSRWCGTDSLYHISSRQAHAIAKTLAELSPVLTL